MSECNLKVIKRTDCEQIKEQTTTTTTTIVINNSKNNDNDKIKESS